MFDFLAYDPSFRGGVRVATGDINGDGFPDIITVPGPGGGPNVRVFSGKDLTLLQNFMAFPSRLSTGLYVAAGDISGDGKADVMLRPTAAPAPTCAVYDGATAKLLLNTFVFDPRFLGGVRLAAGDVNGDQVADIVVAAGPGGGPNVEIYDGQTHAVLESYMAYDAAFTGGVFVATGVFSNLANTEAPKHDIVTGPGQGGGANIRVFDGQPGPLRNFLAGPEGFIFAADGFNPEAEAHVSVVDHNNGKFDDILVGYGAGANAAVNIYDFTTLNRIDFFFAYNPLFQGGVYVASGH